MSERIHYKIQSRPPDDGALWSDYSTARNLLEANEAVRLSTLHKEGYSFRIIRVTTTEEVVT